MYIPTHFDVHELVPRHVYLDRGQKALQLLDPRGLIFIDYLRDMFGRATINNYMWGGDREWSGLRTYGSPYYSRYSQHPFGRAFDILFEEYSAVEVRMWLEDNVGRWQKATGVKSITLEEGVDWVHVDFRNNFDGYNSFWP